MFGVISRVLRGVRASVKGSVETREVQSCFISVDKGLLKHVEAQYLLDYVGLLEDASDLFVVKVVPIYLTALFALRVFAELMSIFQHVCSYSRPRHWKGTLGSVEVVHYGVVSGAD